MSASSNGRLAPTPTTAIPDIDALIEDMLTSRASLPTLAKRHGLTLRELTDALQCDDAQRAMRRLRHALREHAALLAMRAQPDAVRTLRRLAARAEQPEIQRKSSVDVLRLGLLADADSDAPDGESLDDATRAGVLAALQRIGESDGESPDA